MTRPIRMRVHVEKVTQSIWRVKIRRGRLRRLVFDGLVADDAFAETVAQYVARKPR